uniref:Conserved oligomeric Golgi complex subunit 3 n=1 Tax=Salmo trutta TaxID=8032 RepID=A0A673YEY3_SALTR
TVFSAAARREKLSQWDRRTDKQTDSVHDIRAAAETLSIPADLTLTTGVCWLTIRSTPFKGVLLISARYLYKRHLGFSLKQSELVALTENIQQKLSYFNELENINTKLNPPTLSVNSEGSIPKLLKLDECIEYVSSHVMYLAKFQQCLSKAMHFMKTLGCAFMFHVCQDEHQLEEVLELLCLSLYDVLRPLIIRGIHLETLSELCGILNNEMLEDHVHKNAGQLGDVQERLIYRTHIYIQTDAPGDLAYPEMMERIAQSLKEEQTKLMAQVSSFSDVAPYVSPADLHGMCYPTVRRTLVCLSKLLQRAVFQGLSQEALSACIQSLLKASSCHPQEQVDGQLFPIKHLFIMREQMAPSHTDFAIKEISLDLKRTRDAAFKMMNPKSVPSFFRLNSHNAILEFLLEASPEIKEHYIDWKKDVDRHLKFSCEQFIQQQTHLSVGNLEEFLTEVSALKTMVIQGGPTHNLSQQPWATINDVVMSTYRVMKSKLPSTLQSMSLYLANGNTEFILFKPIRNNIQQVFQRLHTVIQEKYSREDLQIIACPSMYWLHYKIRTKVLLQP